MAETSFPQIYSEIEEQESEITKRKAESKKQREQAQQYEEEARKGGRVLRRVHPRTPPAEWEQRKVQLRETRGYISKSERQRAEGRAYEAELEGFRSDLMGQKAEIKGYETRGLQVRKTLEDKYEFYEPAPPMPEVPKLSGEKIWGTGFGNGDYGQWIPIEHAKAVILYEAGGKVQEVSVPWGQLESQKASIKARRGTVQNVLAVSTQQAQQIMGSEEIKASMWFKTLPPETFATYKKFEKYITTKVTYPKPTIEQRILKAQYLGELSRTGKLTTGAFLKITHPGTEIKFETITSPEVKPFLTEEQRFKAMFEKRHPVEQQIAYFFGDFTKSVSGMVGLVAGVFGYKEPEPELVTKVHYGEPKEFIKVGTYYYDPYKAGERWYEPTKSVAEWLGLQKPGKYAKELVHDIGYGQSLILDVAPITPTPIDVPLSKIPSPFGEGYLSEEWKARWIKEHPESLIAGGAGLGFSFAAWGMAFRPVGAAARAGVKTIVTKAPTVVTKLKAFTGISKPLLESESMLLESGMVVGKPITALTKISGLTTKIGETQFWKNIHGYSASKLTFVRTLPMAKGYPSVQRFEGGIFGKIEKFKGFGRRELVPTRVAQQFKLGEQVTHAHKYIDGTVGAGRQQIYMSQLVGKPKGLLFRRVTRQTLSYRGFDPFRFETMPSEAVADTWGGWIRPGYTIPAEDLIAVTKGISKVSPKFLVDARATASLVRPVSVYHPVSFAPMHHAGYISGAIQIPVTSTMGAQLFGSAFAMGSIAAQVQKNLQGLKHESMLERKSQMKYDLKFELMPKKLLGISSISAQFTEQWQIQQPSRISLSMQGQIQIPALKQELKTILEPPTRYTLPIPPREKTPSPITPKIPHIYIPSFDGVGKRKKKKRGIEGFDLGWRIKYHKVPSLEQFLKGGI